MKLKLLLFTILSTYAFSALSEGSKNAPAGAYSGIKEVKNNPEEKDGGTLQKLLSVQGVDSQYQACVKAGTPEENLPKCIWEGDGTIPPLSADVKKKVTAMYDQESTGNSRAPASTNANTKTGNLTRKSTNIAVDYMSDPAVEALSKVFQKKLEEALLGDTKAQSDTKTVAAVDHSKFIELYKTELGKTIVNSFTSYCMESDVDQPEYSTSTYDCEDDKKNKIQCPLYFLSSNTATTISKNIAKLKTANLSSSTDKVSNPDSSKWTSCIASVSRICYTETSNISVTSPGAPTTPTTLDDSRKKACVIMDYVKSARKNLLAAEEQKKFYGELEKNAAAIGSIGQIGNARTVAVTDKNTMDAVTTLTSKDIEDSYEKKNKEVVQKEMDACFENGQVKDTEACKKFIQTDPEEKKKELAEFGLRQFAQGETIDKQLVDDDQVKKYLKEEGYDDAKIAEMSKNPKDIELIRQDIKKRFANERDAIIATMADKIKTKTTAGNQVDKQKDQSKINDIKDEIAKRPDDLKQLVHFSNIVSSYLEIDNGTTKSRNIASLYAELNGTASNIKNVDKDEAKALRESAGQAGLQENKNPKQDTGTNLGVETLNKLFKYTTEK